jgi:long-chain acyl-CoA synthetase
VLFDIHPGEVGVAGVPDATSEAVAPVVWLERLPRRGARTFCREELAPYKVPAHVEFRVELPKTMVGKVLRRALRDEHLRKSKDKS